MGDVVHRAEALHGDLLADGLALLLGQGVGHVGGDEAGGDGVGRDAAGCKLAGDGLRQTDDARLRCRVVRLAGVAADAGDARHVHDAPVALLHHDLARSAADMERALQVHVDDAIEVIVLHAHHKPVARDAGVVDHGIKAAEGLMRLLDQRVRLGFIGHACRDGLYLHAMFAGDAASLLAQHGKARLARAVQRHIEAGSRQLLGDRKADTARAAGDKRRAAGGILRFVHVLFLILGVFGNECIEGSRILDAGTGRLAVDAFDKVRQHPAEADLGEHGSTLID